MAVFDSLRPAVYIVKQIVQMSWHHKINSDRPLRVRLNTKRDGYYYRRKLPVIGKISVPR